tara:strand:- start:1953 stop:2519 length:567 start_codon:yes stop_codon:yes gene_type:complete
MGDMSKEPSMEEILSSIKRIIAEDGEDAASGAGRKGVNRESTRMSHRKSVVASMAELDEDALSYVDEVLELTDEMPRIGKGAAADPAEAAKRRDSAEAPDAGMCDGEAAETQAGASIVSPESELAARSSLAALSSMMVKPADGSENTLEGLVREMLRPMMKEWLDANLPTLVEGMVAKEIARITGRSL